MADVFISYSQQDRPKVDQLAQRLSEVGVSVWYDQHIAGGKNFSHEIEEQLDQAQAVVVVWSAHSIRSMWVPDEAAVGRDRGILVPLSIDGTEPPIGFRQLQTIDFSGWDGRSSQLPFEQLTSVLKTRLEDGDAISSIARTPETHQSHNRRPLLWGSFATALILAIVLLMTMTDPSQGNHGQGAIDSTHESDAAATTSSLPILAVLPFKVIGSYEEQTYLAEGVAEEILGQLSRIDGLQVIGRISAAMFANESDLKTVGRALGATHILSGSLQKQGQQLRVRAQLVTTEDGHNQWSERFDRELNDIFEIQDDIANAVAQAVNVTLYTDAAPIHTEFRDLTAYDFYLRGINAGTNFRQLGEDGSIALLEQAIKLEPEWPDARAMLAVEYQRLSLFTPPGSPEVTARQERAIELAETALALDPDNAVAMSAIAAVNVIRWNWVYAHKLLNQASATAPEDSTAAIYRSTLAELSGKADVALKIAQDSLAYDPVNPALHGRISTLAYRLGDFELSVKHGQLASDYGENPQRFAIGLALAMAALGQNTEVSEFINKLSKDPRFGPNDYFNQPVFKLIKDYQSDDTRSEYVDWVKADPNGLAYLATLRHIGAEASAEEMIAKYFGQITALDNPYSLRSLFTLTESNFRKTEQFKTLIRNHNLPQYWRAFGWPKFCRPTGPDSFTCH